MRFSFIALLFFTSIIGLAQSVPQKINYQAVARQSNGSLIANQTIAVKAEIIDSNQTTVLYAETHICTTNSYGLFTMKIGGGTVVSGVFSTISWGSGDKYVRISVDLSGGTNFQLMGMSQLLSVPFALYAQEVANTGGLSKFFAQNPYETQAEVAKRITDRVGANTQTIWINNNNNITSLDLSKVNEIEQIVIGGNPNLQTINLSNLKNCNSNQQGGISISGDQLSSINLDNLEDITGVSIGIALTKLNSLSLNKLKTISLNSFAVSENSLLQHVFLNGLIKIVNGSLDISNNPAIVEVSLPQLEALIGGSGLGISTNSSLTNIDLSALNTISDNSPLYLNQNKLTTSCVNTILAKLASITPHFSGCTINLKQSVAAPPSGQGITNKALITSWGNTVITD